MDIQDNTSTGRFHPGQKVWCRLSHNDVAHEYWIVDVTPKTVHISATEQYHSGAYHKITFDEALKKLTWTLNQDKIRDNLWLTERDSKEALLDNKRKSIAKLIAQTNRLISERDALAAELGVDPRLLKKKPRKYWLQLHNGYST